jgi:hypothetical protein
MADQRMGENHHYQLEDTMTMDEAAEGERDEWNLELGAVTAMPDGDDTNIEWMTEMTARPTNTASADEKAERGQK